MPQSPKRAYSFKEGLAMMAAKDVGIDPYLAADAGDDARTILAALRRAKTARGPEKAKHIAAAQTDLRKLNPKQHGKLINALQGKVLALQGRGGDTAVAHLEPGEMVIPRRVLTPELAQLIADEAAKRGIDPKQLIVGNRRASINPATGAEEFGLFTEQSPHYGSSLDRSRDPQEQQVALGWLARQAIPKSVEEDVRGSLNRLTGGQLSPHDQNRLYDDVIKNIDLGDAMKFQSIDPSADPMTLNGDQCKIVRGQLDDLTRKKSPIASAADEQFRKALEAGRVRCP